jgi:hypothetical protein
VGRPHCRPSCASVLEFWISTPMHIRFMICILNSEWRKFRTSAGPTGMLTSRASRSVCILHARTLQIPRYSGRVLSLTGILAVLSFLFSLPSSTPQRTTMGSISISPHNVLPNPFQFNIHDSGTPRLYTVRHTDTHVTSNLTTRIYEQETNSNQKKKTCL